MSDQEPEAKVYDSLTPKRRRFVDAYLETWNETEAARRINYAHPRQQGSRLFSNVDIQAAIHERLEDMAMQADEVLKRLADQGRVNVADFVREKMIPEVDKDGSVIFEIQGIELNWQKIKDCGHLVKSITSTQYGPKIEVYDGQAALVQIGKHLKLFTENVDLTSGGKPLDDGIYERVLERIQSRVAGDQPPGTVAAPDQPEEE